MLHVEFKISCLLPYTPRWVIFDMLDRFKNSVGWTQIFALPIVRSRWSWVLVPCGRPQGPYPCQTLASCRGRKRAGEVKMLCKASSCWEAVGLKKYLDFDVWIRFWKFDIFGWAFSNGHASTSLVEITKRGEESAAGFRPVQKWFGRAALLYTSKELERMAPIFGGCPCLLDLIKHWAWRTKSASRVSDYQWPHDDPTPPDHLKPKKRQIWFSGVNMHITYIYIYVYIHAEICCNKIYIYICFSWNWMMGKFTGKPYIWW